MKKIMLSILTLLVISVNTTKANTIVVQNNNDSSTGSLRQSIIDANNGDTIRFNPNLIAGGSGTILLSSEIVFSKELVFKGLYNVTDTLYISGNNTNRIFKITNTTQVTIDSMAFVNGNVATGGGGALAVAGVDSVFVNNSMISNSSAQYGGGIDLRTNSTNNGIASQILLNINNSNINNNSSTYGGGVHIGGSNISLIINNSIINNNSATTIGGGGIAAFSFYDGSVTIDNSTINNNSSSTNGGGLKVESYYTDFYTTINNTNFDNNTASNTGGGICSVPAGISSVVLNNTTVSNNTASVGGGVYSGSYNASQSIVALTHSTVSGNHATNDFGGIASLAQIVNFTAINSTISDNSTATSWNKCGGVYVFGYNSASIEFTSSIVWTSIGDNIKHETVDGGGSIVPSTDPIISGGYNIFSNAPNGANATGDLTNVSANDLNLQALANYGGSVLTIQPGIGSVAINAGNPSDVSDAQNTPITGIRDIGSTESSNTLVSSITVQGQGGVSTITTQGGTLQMEATVLPANADDGTYTWSVMNGTGSASIDNNGLLTAISDGTVDVTATANDVSGETGTITITISNQSLGINKNSSQNISIYPNPVQNQLFVESNELEITEISILDYSGQLVKLITNNTTNQIDVSDLKQGVYILKVVSKEGMSTSRFVKK
jgi:hypothetical protein